MKVRRGTRGPKRNEGFGKRLPFLIFLLYFLILEYFLFRSSPSQSVESFYIRGKFLQRAGHLLRGPANHLPVLVYGIVLLMANRAHRSLVWTSFQLDILDKLENINYTEHTHIRYVSCQVEQAPETGRLHVQGYVEFSRPCRYSYWQAQIGDNTCHCEPRRGTREQARSYTRKEESRLWGPYEYGTWTAGGTGTRNDLAEVKRALDSGVSQAQVAEDHFDSWVRYRRSFEAYANIRAAGQTDLRAVRTTVLWGDTGVGKSFRAHRHSPGAYRLEAPNADHAPLWWDGYESQQTVIIDDFESWISYRTLLRILDPYPMRLPIKGGFAIAQFTHVIITSNRDPLLWYPEHSPAILGRRLNAVYHITSMDDNIIMAG